MYEETKFVNLEMISFLLLDRYINPAPLDEELKTAALYYLEALTAYGTKAELTVPARTFLKIAADLSPAERQKYRDYFHNAAEEVLTSNTFSEEEKALAEQAQVWLKNSRR